MSGHTKNVVWVLSRGWKRKDMATANHKGVWRAGVLALVLAAGGAVATGQESTGGVRRRADGQPDITGHWKSRPGGTYDPEPSR